MSQSGSIWAMMCDRSGVTTRSPGLQADPGIGPSLEAESYLLTRRFHTRPLHRATASFRGCASTRTVADSLLITMRG